MTLAARNYHSSLALSFILLASVSTNLHAKPVSAELQAAREHVVHQYIEDLGRADYNDLSNLFVEGGTVVSTSRGTVGAVEFFSSFLSQVQNANTQYHQGFVSSQDNNRYAARFYFAFSMQDGEQGAGEYVDEFVFKENSAKLMQVYMFENLKF